MVPARADETFGSGRLVQQDNAAIPCLQHYSWHHVCVSHKDLHASFVPSAYADKLCFTIAGVAHTNASGTDWDYCMSLLEDWTQDRLVVGQSTQTWEKRGLLHLSPVHWSYRPVLAWAVVDLKFFWSLSADVLSMFSRVLSNLSIFHHTEDGFSWGMSLSVWITRMYFFPRSVSGNGPRISIAIRSSGYMAGSICKGALCFFGWDFLAAHIWQALHHSSTSRLWPTQ